METVPLQEINQSEAKEMFEYFISNKLGKKTNIDSSYFVGNLLMSIINNNNMALNIETIKHFKDLDLSLLRKDSIHFVFTDSSEKQFLEDLTKNNYRMPKGWKTSDDFNINLEKLEDYILVGEDSSIHYLPAYGLFVANRQHINEIIKFIQDNLAYIVKLIRKTGIPNLIINKQSNMYIRQGLFNEYLSKKQEIELEEHIKNFKSSRRKDNIRETITQYINYIKDREREINNYRQKIEEEELKLIFGYSDNTSLFKSLLLSDKRIDKFSFDNNGKTISIVTKELQLIHYDEMKMKKVQENGLEDAPDKFKKALKQVLDENAKIYVGSYTIKIGATGKDLAYEFRKNSKYGNSHWEGYTCLGNFSESFTRAIREDRPDTLLLMILEYLQSMNFGDAGSSRIHEFSYILNNEGEKIYG